MCLYLIHTYRELSLLGEEGNKEVSDLSWVCVCVCVLALCMFLSCRTKASRTSLRTFSRLTGLVLHCNLSPPHPIYDPFSTSLLSLSPLLPSSSTPSSYLLLSFPSPLSPYRMGVCVGEYPGFLLDAWEDYDIEYKSQNDKPGL